MGKASKSQSAGEHLRIAGDLLPWSNILEARQLMPTPWLSMLSQHATTEPASQDGGGLGELGLGRADTAMAMERTLRMVVNCILLVVW